MKTNYLPTIVMSALLALGVAAQSQNETILIDATAPGRPFLHFWEQAFSSGRAILSLRESYRNGMREVKKATDFHYVRFHNILHDEVGI